MLVASLLRCSLHLYSLTVHSSNSGCPFLTLEESRKNHLLALNHRVSATKCTNQPVKLQRPRLVLNNSNPLADLQLVRLATRFISCRQVNRNRPGDNRNVCPRQPAASTNKPSSSSSSSIHLSIPTWYP